MTRMYIALFSLSLLAFVGGCRNCGGGCCLLNGFGNQTIAPPPTFGMNNQQPYYNTAQQPGYLVNPNSRAPTPAGNNPSLAPQEGWRKAGDQTNNANNGQAVSVLANNNANQPPTNRIASLDPNAGFYNSQTGSVNYQSTSIDERRDDTRIPVTDASQVRAPAAFYGPASVNNNNPNSFTRMAQARYGTPINGNYSGYAQNNAPVLTAPGQTIVNGQVVNGNQFYQAGIAPYQPNRAYPSASYPEYGIQGQTVVAQATAEYDPRNNPNFDNGWRDREMSTDNVSRQ